MMNKRAILVTMAAMAVASLAFPSFTAPRQDIVDTAVGVKQFTILVKAVQAADLVDALKADGPLTVFAPTDAAFQKLEKAKPGTLANLLKPENKEMLTKILTYHVVAGKITAKDVKHLKDGAKVKTLNGASITVNKSHGIRLDQSKLVKTNIGCTNGVIHVIDTVLMPK